MNDKMLRAISLAMKILRIDEGFRDKPYFDHLGFATIGFGRRLPGTTRHDPLPQITTTREAEEKFLLDNVLSIYNTISNNDLSRPFAAMSEVRQAVTISLAYQHGVYGLLKFYNFRKAIAVSDYDWAADEIIDSNTWRDPQTRPRMQRNADMMRTGKLLDYYQ